MLPSRNFDPASFKDPSGRVFFEGHEVFRTIDPKAEAVISPFLKSNAYLQNKNLFVETNKLSDELLQHKKIEEISYCYEWPPEAWRAAALLTLDIQIILLNENLSLKDATPFNVLFEKGHPIFIDITSIEHYEKDQPWIAFKEFLENFVYPLMSYSYLGISGVGFDSLGKIDIENASRLFGKLPIWTPGILKYVKIPAYLHRSALKRSTLSHHERSARIPKNLLISNCKNLRSFIEGLRFDRTKRHWYSYTETCSYTQEDRQAKNIFVQNFVRLLSKKVCLKRALDLGANTGEYSELLVSAVPSVIAVENDLSCADQIFLKSSKNHLNILPVTMNFARPTPAIGWSLQERRSFYDRFCDSDLLIALAFIHHLRITENIPFDLIFGYFAKLACHVIVEWVPREDPMVQKLLSGKKCDYKDYNEDHFLAIFTKYFRITQKVKLNSGRMLISATKL